ncbi:MAG: anhydro-N-acetylmuramic acid kinase [Gammaproteobacteria bacterium]|nr:anhydro-N-acetylmuramic acid kinase [Gammaproteobacteria bacterium]
MPRYIGLISGTSMDGIDAALVEVAGGKISLIAYRESPYPEDLHRELERAVTTDTVSLSGLAALHVRVGREFAGAALALFSEAGQSWSDVSAIGSHGQTLWHAPSGAVPCTLQIGDGASIAVATGLPVICDFRSSDVALGGQGAPLVPLFHEALFGRTDKPTAVVNIGGLANVTLLTGEPSGGLIAFDTGPGNTLMDGWAALHLGSAFDAGGDWARGGKLLPELLDRLLAEPYFSSMTPKSTGRELFNLGWLRQRLGGLGAGAPADVQRTLLELTAVTISQEIRRHQPEGDTVFVCGGGTRNGFLMQRLVDLLPHRRVQSTDEAGVPAAALEAMAFAWLAHRRLAGLAGNAPSVTGATRPAVLGALYLP